MFSKKYKHLKTGNIYEVIRDDVVNCTNANDDQIMVLYKTERYPDKIFVREINEFNEKFKPL
ncbi:DUF1653 domain-containing protein [bacterium]|nr:DUF1653 domain-containing protein [bacterium]